MAHRPPVREYHLHTLLRFVPFSIAHISHRLATVDEKSPFFNTSLAESPTFERIAIRIKSLRSSPEEVKSAWGYILRSRCPSASRPTSFLSDYPRVEKIADRSTNLPSNASHSYAFVEFRSARDAEASFDDMHGRNFEGYRLTVEWAKRLPSSLWRTGGRSPPRRSTTTTTTVRDRSRSPRRSDRDRDNDKDEKRRRSRSRSRDRRDKEGDREKETGDERNGDRKHSASLERKSSERHREGSARTPPHEDTKINGDRALTPPVDH